MAYKRNTDSERRMSEIVERDSARYITYSSGTSRRSSSRSSSGRSSVPSKRRRKRRRRWRIRPIPALIILIMVIIICATALSRNAVEVFVNKTSIGYVEGKVKDVTVEDLTATLISQLSQQAGTEVKLNEEISVRTAHASKDEMVTADAIITKLKENVTYKVKAAIITIDGKEAGVVSSMSEANAFFENYAKQYIKEDADLKSWEFTLDVKAEEAYVEADKIVSTDIIKSQMTETHLEPAVYVVESGDTLYAIAERYGTTFKQLQADNPNLTSKLVIGQKINVLVPTPYVSVRTIEEYVEIQPIPRSTEEEVDQTKAKDYKKVVQQGHDGERKITKEVTKLNGVFESEAVIEDKVVLEPENDIIVVGRR